MCPRRLTQRRSTYQAQRHRSRLRPCQQHSNHQWQQCHVGKWPQRLKAGSYRWQCWSTTPAELEHPEPRREDSASTGTGDARHSHGQDDSGRPRRLNRPAESRRCLGVPGSRRRARFRSRVGEQSTASNAVVIRPLALSNVIYQCFGERVATSRQLRASTQFNRLSAFGQRAHHDRNDPCPSASVALIQQNDITGILTPL